MITQPLFVYIDQNQLKLFGQYFSVFQKLDPTDWPTIVKFEWYPTVR